MKRLITSGHSCFTQFWHNMAASPGRCDNWKAILGYESLLVAIATHHFGCFRKLMECDDLISHNDQGQPDDDQLGKLLDLAVYEDDLNCVKLLMEKFMPSLNLARSVKWAIKARSNECLSLLLEHVDLETSSSQLQLVLKALIEAGELATLDIFIQNESIREQHGYFALVESARVGNVDCMQTLLEEKVCTKGTHPWEEKSPLQLAVENGNYACVELLLKTHLQDDPSKVTSSTMQQLQDALKNQEIENMSTETLKCGRQFLLFKPREGGSHLGEYLLRRALQRKDMVAVKKMLHFWSKNLNIDLEDALGQTPLMHVVSQGLTDIVGPLLLLGADPLKQDSNGLSALKISHCHDKSDCYTMLRRHMEVEKISRGKQSTGMYTYTMPH